MVDQLNVAVAVGIPVAGSGKILADAIYLNQEMNIIENNNRNNKVIISENIGDFKYKNLGNCKIIHINKIQKLI